MDMAERRGIEGSSFAGRAVIYVERRHARVILPSLEARLR